MSQWTAERRHRLHNDPKSGTIMGSPQAWNGLKLNGKVDAMEYRRFQGNEGLPKNLEMGCRITKKNKENMSCE